MIHLFNRPRLVAAFLVGVVGVLAPNQVNADFTLTIETTGGVTPASVTIKDDDKGLDNTWQVAGLITFAGVIGDFGIQVSTGSSNALQNVTPAVLTINNLSITGNFVGTRTLTITLEDTGFTAPSVGQQAIMQSQLSTTSIPANTNVTFQSFMNDNPGTLLALNSLGVASADNTLVIPSSPYRLKNVTTYEIVGTGSTTYVQSYGNTTVALPAPNGLVLSLIGLPMTAVGWMIRRRKKTN